MVGVVEEVGGSGRVSCVCVSLNERVKGEEVARIGLWVVIGEKLKVVNSLLGLAIHFYYGFL